MGATELAPGEVLKGLLILAGIVVSLVVIFGATFFGWGDTDEDRCEQIGADVEAGRYSGQRVGDRQGSHRDRAGLVALRS